MTMPLSGQMLTIFHVACVMCVCGYETWHLVDIASVVCDKPADMPPPNVGIELGTNMIMDAPHVFSILRTSENPVKVVFTVKDSDGTEVIPKQDLTLEGFEDTPLNPNCKCTSLGAGDSANYDSSSAVPENYGSLCFNWDQDTCATTYGFAGSWCCDAWCYTTEDCPGLGQSVLYEGYFFSRAPCANFPKPQTCKWSNWEEEQSPCACKDQSGIFSADMKNKFGNHKLGKYGASCKTWDLDTCETNYPGQTDTWCCEKWCYVDKTCESYIPSYNLPDTLFWSSHVCETENDPLVVNSCMYKKAIQAPVDEQVLADKCKCLGDQNPSFVLGEDELKGLAARANVSKDSLSEYGRKCNVHDLNICEKLYGLTGSFCCSPWCFVSEDCPTGENHSYLPGRFIADAACDISNFSDEISSCEYDTSCDCIAEVMVNDKLVYMPSEVVLPQTLTTKLTNAGYSPDDYGKKCGAWDNTSCKALWGPGVWTDVDPNLSSPYNSVDEAANQWCCWSWCYVKDSCKLADVTLVGVTDKNGEALSYSYETCNDEEQIYSPPTDSCTAAPRRLGARRRGGGGGGGARRRSYSAPRRRTYSAPRRRASNNAGYRRRTPSRPTNSQTPRRRSPGYSNPRRRVQPQPQQPQPYRPYGQQQTYNSPGGQPMGYGSTGSAYNNYNGVPPQSTSYGMQGHNAYSPGKKPNVAMYAAGGAAAGLVAGAGAMYMYQSYNDDTRRRDGWGTYGRRRHRAPNQYNSEYCIVPSTAPAGKAGTFMECTSCDHWYGSCRRADNCYEPSGCSYELQTNLNRDDLMGTAFYPNQVKWPLKVEFEKIEAADINKKEICPPVTEAEIAEFEAFNYQLVIKADMFVTLTQMEEQRQTSVPVPCTCSNGNPGTMDMYDCRDNVNNAPCGQQVGAAIRSGSGSPLVSCVCLVLASIWFARRRY